MADPRLFELARMPLHERAVRIAEMFADPENDAPAALTPAKRRAARREAFRERPMAALRRRLAVLGHWLAPRHLFQALVILSCMARDWATDGGLPSPLACGQRPMGFCGRAASLAPDYLIEAVSRGLTLRNFLGAATLWSPPTRAVLRPWDIPCGVPATLSAAARVSLDESFDDVLLASARGSIDPWAHPSLDLSLSDLYDAGFAHSLEIRDPDGQLIAGLIGIAVGGVFTIERLFARDPEALARGVNHLAFQLQRWNFALIDVPTPSELALRLRCAAMNRAAYAAELAGNGCGGRHGRWRMSDDLRRPTHLGASLRAAS